MRQVLYWWNLYRMPYSESTTCFLFNCPHTFSNHQHVIKRCRIVISVQYCCTQQKSYWIWGKWQITQIINMSQLQCCSDYILIGLFRYHMKIQYSIYFVGSLPSCMLCSAGSVDQNSGNRCEDYSNGKNRIKGGWHLWIGNLLKTPNLFLFRNGWPCGTSISYKLKSAGLITCKSGTRVVMVLECFSCSGRKLGPLFTSGQCPATSEAACKCQAFECNCRCCFPKTSATLLCDLLLNNKEMHFGIQTDIEIIGAPFWGFLLHFPPWSVH